MLKLKLQYFGHLMRRVDSLEKTVMLGGIGGRRRRGRQRMRWLDGITDLMAESEWTPGVGDGQGGLACCDSWGRKESDTTEQLIWSDHLIDKLKIVFSLWWELSRSTLLITLLITFSLLPHRCSLHILDIKPSSNLWIEKLIFQFVVHVFILSVVSFQLV